MKVLGGAADYDETHQGGKDANKPQSKKFKRGQETVCKQIIWDRNKCDRPVPTNLIGTSDRSTFHTKIHENVEYGAPLSSNEHKGYHDGLNRTFDKQTRANHINKRFVDGIAYTISIESVWTEHKHGYYNIFNNWAQQHFRTYVYEVTFRENERDVKRESKKWFVDLSKTMVDKSIRFQKLTGVPQ